MSQLSRLLMGNSGTHLTARQRARHIYLIGQSGTGKSRLLEYLAFQDARAGRGVAVVDVHGDLYANLKGQLGTVAQLWAKVVFIEPTDSRWVVVLIPWAS